MAINNFPYTNFHELNLDWIIRSIKVIQSDMESKFQESLNGYFNNIMPNVLYNEVAEEITLQFVPIVAVMNSPNTMEV